MGQLSHSQTLLEYGIMANTPGQTPFFSSDAEMLIYHDSCVCVCFFNLFMIQGEMRIKK